MPQVQLTDRAFQAARAQAEASGFGSVDEYVEDVLLDEAGDAGGEFDAARFFTPERLAELDRAMEDVRAGRVLTLEQVDAELARRREAWLKANGQ